MLFRSGRDRRVARERREPEDVRDVGGTEREADDVAMAGGLAVPGLERRDRPEGARDSVDTDRTVIKGWPRLPVSAYGIIRTSAD